MTEKLLQIAQLLDEAEDALTKHLPEVARDKFELAESIAGHKLNEGRGKRVYREIQFAFAKGEECKFCDAVRCALVELRNTALYIYYGLKRR